MKVSDRICTTFSFGVAGLAYWHGDHGWAIFFVGEGLLVMCDAICAAIRARSDATAGGG